MCIAQKNHEGVTKVFWRGFHNYATHGAMMRLPVFCRIGSHSSRLRNHGYCVLLICCMSATLILLKWNVMFRRLLRRIHRLNKKRSEIWLQYCAPIGLSFCTKIVAVRWISWYIHTIRLTKIAKWPNFRRTFRQTCRTCGKKLSMHIYHMIFVFFL